ncbi:hypothetical protein GGR56DRAFT_638772 [Xylariaceae sp. FL0804]|nr:hypothetical protein GGR56DRAFT_638772 [Xylariaceae sp. FL0804]
MIVEIEKDRDTLSGVCEDGKQKLLETSTRINALEEKIRTYRAHLNKATEEQQRIFKYCQQKCQQAVDEVKAEEQDHREEMQKAIEVSESARDEIRRKVAMVINSSRQEVDELNETIRSLKIQLIEREKDVKNEQQHALELREQLNESQRLNREAIHSLNTHTKELLEKAEQGSEQGRSSQEALRQQDTKIESVLRILKEVKAGAPDLACVLEILNALQNDVVNSATARTQETAASCQEAKEGGLILQENIRSIRSLYDTLKEKEAQQQDIAMWEESYHNAVSESEDRAERIILLNIELAHFKANFSQKADECERLRQEKDSLSVQLGKEAELNFDACQASAEKVEEYKLQIEQLVQKDAESHSILEKKDTELTKLKSDLRSVHEGLDLESRKYQESESQIRRNSETHEKAIQAISSVARQKEQAAEKSKQELQQAVERCQQMEAARRQVLGELSEARRLEPQTSNVNLEGDLDLIREELKTTVTSMKSLTAKLKASEDCRELLLEGLDKWSKDRVEIANMQQLIQKMASDHTSSSKFGRDMKELLVVLEKLSNTHNHHEKQLRRLREITRADQMTLREPGPEELDELERVEVQERRVVVKSPFTEDNIVPLVSVEEEKATRRQAAAPRGILKEAHPMVTRSVSRELDIKMDTGELPSNTKGESQRTARVNKPKIAKRGSKMPLTTHSTYNRPVAGSISNAVALDAGNLAPNHGERPGSRKRQHSDGGPIAGAKGESATPSAKQHQEMPDVKRPKLSRAMSSHFAEPPQHHQQAHADERTPESRLLASRDTPHQRVPTGLRTYGYPSSDIFETPKRGSESSQTVVPRYVGSARAHILFNP